MPRVKGLLDRKLENAAYRARFERNYPAFVLEVLLLKALERKGWTFDHPPRTLNTGRRYAKLTP